MDFKTLKFQLASRLRFEKFIFERRIFIPSVRKTLFFQKKIKLFNVQFMVNIVVTQMWDNLALEACLFSVLRLYTMYTTAGIDNSTRQATTNKQVEILFKSIVVLFSGDVRSFYALLWKFWTAWSWGTALGGIRQG